MSARCRIGRLAVWSGRVGPDDDPAKLVLAMRALGMSREDHADAMRAIGRTARRAQISSGRRSS